MLNKTLLQGRLVADPELRTTQSGVSMVSFRVAWSEKYKETETKLFLGCTAWRGTAEFISKYFVKGQELAVEGKLSTREYTDKEGNRRSLVELTVEQAHFCGSKADRQSGGYAAAEAPAAAAGSWQPPPPAQTDMRDAQRMAPDVAAGYVPMDFTDEDIPF